MKKKYMLPSTVVYTLHIGTMLNDASIYVNKEEEGDQSEAEGRYLHQRSVWDDDDE